MYIKCTVLHTHGTCSMYITQVQWIIICCFHNHSLLINVFLNSQIYILPMIFVQNWINNAFQFFYSSLKPLSVSGIFFPRPFSVPVICCMSFCQILGFCKVYLKKIFKKSNFSIQRLCFIKNRYHSISNENEIELTIWCCLLVCWLNIRCYLFITLSLGHINLNFRFSS